VAQAKKEGATKRTFRLDDDLMSRLNKIARSEGRTLTAQMERFLWASVREYKKAAEKSPGPRLPARKAA
jgi:predicted transcriptional regulator